ncbi:MAG: methyltransferase domain-containing protein [bacterium]|nr:methyltransferase domain-containing protein [bacterium]
MMFAFQLAGEDLKLAEQEVLSIVNAKAHQLDNNLLLVETSNIESTERLAYTHAIYEVLFTANNKTLEKQLEEFNWQSIYKKDFALRTINMKQSESYLAGFIWNKLKKPKVNLKNPKTSITLFNSKKIYCCKLIKEIKKDFMNRKAQFRPGFMPTSLHPRLARAAINLTGLKKGTILDPFCGTGGILIEASLMGFSTIGYDIDKFILKKCEENMKFFKLKNYKLESKDALKLNKPACIVTDLPYGKNSKLTEPLENLYLNFLKKIKKRSVVIFPSFINHKKLIKKANLKIEHEFTYYLHKSLSKKIVVLNS